MEFTVNQVPLSNRLNFVLGIVPPKSPFPILSNALVKTENERLYLTTTNLDISVTTELDADVSVGGEQIVPARRFWEIVKELPSGEVNIKGSEGQLEILSSTGKYKVLCPPMEDFPAIPDLERDVTTSINVEELKRLIDKTGYSVLADGTRPILGGILLESGPFGIRAVSTDGHRLSLYQIPSGATQQVMRAVIPSKALSLLARMGDEGQADIYIGDGDMWFVCGRSRVFTKLVSGTFPDYERVIPTDNDKRMVVDREELAASLRRVSILSRSDTHQVVFTMSQGKLQVSSRAVEIGEAVEELEVSYSGEPFEVAYNAQYLLEILRHIDSDQVVMSFKTSTTAGVVEPGEMGEGEKQLCLIMPLHMDR